MQKSKIAEWGKKSKSLKWSQNSLNYLGQWSVTGDKKKLHLFLKIGY